MNQYSLPDSGTILERLQDTSIAIDSRIRSFVFGSIQAYANGKLNAEGIVNMLWSAIHDAVGFVNQRLGISLDPDQIFIDCAKQIITALLVVTQSYEQEVLDDACAQYTIHVQGIENRRREAKKLLAAAVTN